MDLVVQDDGELPERLATAVAEDVLLLVLAGWCRRATVGALGQHDDGVEVAVHQAIAVAHVQDRARGAGADIAARLVVDVAIGVAPGRRGARGALQLVVRKLRPVPARTLRLDVDRSEKAKTNLPAITLAADRCGGRVGEIGALLAGAPPRHHLLTGLGERAEKTVDHVFRCGRVEHHALVLRQAHVAAVTTAGGVQRTFAARHRGQRQARDVQRRRARPWPIHAHLAGAHQLARCGRARTGFNVRRQTAVHLARDAALFFPLGIKQVLEGDLQAVAFVDAQHQGARPLVGTQHGIARAERAAGVGGHHVVAQRVQHAGGHEGCESVEHIGLLDRHHVGMNDIAAGATRVRPRTAWRLAHAGAQQRQRRHAAQARQPGCQTWSRALPNARCARHVTSLRLPARCDSRSLLHGWPPSCCDLSTHSLSRLPPAFFLSRFLSSFRNHPYTVRRKVGANQIKLCCHGQLATP